VSVDAGPLRSALLEQRHAEAERVLAHAEERAEARLAEAETTGRALVEQARAEGVAAAAIAGAHEEARARRQARALVLAAKREVFEESRRRALAAAHALRSEPGYASLLERLSARARRQLGASAILEIDPPAGGVRASNGARHVDYTLDALVERCLAQLGTEVEALCR
jgi:vacuolar-type H+-ATPase subunit E/Vma4